MNDPNEIDFTTLNWVKQELDETLKQARQALEAYAENQSDKSQLKYCSTYMHQVQGTLRMVELYGAAMVIEEMEKVALAIVDGQIKQTDEMLEVIMRGLVQMPDYLGRLQGGHRDIPIVLLPLLNDLRACRSETLLTETALFSPNLTVGLPSSAVGANEATPEATMRTNASKLRLAYQFGLLKWIKGDDVDTNLGRLIAILDRLRSMSVQVDARRLWWIASGVIEGVMLKALESSVAVKLLYGKVDREIKRIVDVGEADFDRLAPTELTKSLLYYAAHSENKGARIAEIKQLYKLETLLPSQSEIEHANSALSGRNKALLDTVGAAIKEDIMRVKDGLDMFLRGPQSNVGDLATQGETLQRVADTLGVLGLGIPRKVVIEQRDIVTNIIVGKQAPEEQVLLDVAGALLFVESSLDDYIDRLGQGQSEQLLNAATLKGLELPQAEVRRILDATMKEATINLSQAKQDIVAFIESPWDHSKIEGIPKLLEEISGALRMLNMPEPAELNDGVIRFIEVELLKHRRVPTAEQLDLMADALASIEYYLEAIREARPNRDRILEVTRRSLEALGYWPVPDANALGVSGSLDGAPASNEFVAFPDDFQASRIEPFSLEPIAPKFERSFAQDNEPVLSLSDIPLTEAAAIAATPVATAMDLSGFVLVESASKTPDWHPEMELPSIVDLTESAEIQAPVVENAFELKDIVEPSQPESFVQTEPSVPVQEIVELEIQNSDADNAFSDFDLSMLEHEPADGNLIDFPDFSDLGSVSADDNGSAASQPEQTEAAQAEQAEPFQLLTEVDVFSLDALIGDESLNEAVVVNVEPIVEETKLFEEPKLAEESNLFEESELFEEPKLFEESKLFEQESKLFEEPNLFEEPKLFEESEVFEEPAFDFSAFESESLLPDPSSMPDALATDILLSKNETDVASEPAFVASESAFDVSTLDAFEFELPKVEEPIFQPVEVLPTPRAEHPSITSGFQMVSSDDIDDEIREVFVEEVEDELAGLAKSLPAWKADQNDFEKLKPVRRSFHTLKGSGRLVGALAMGEFSWKVENMLNRVLDKSIPVSPAVLACLDEAVAVLPQLLSGLKGEGNPTGNIGGIMYVADRISAGEEIFLPKNEPVPTAELATEVLVATQAAAGAVPLDKQVQSEVENKIQENSPEVSLITEPTYIDDALQVEDPASISEQALIESVADFSVVTEASSDSPASNEMVDLVEEDQSDVVETIAEQSEHSSPGLPDALANDPVLIDILKIESATHVLAIRTYVDQVRRSGTNALVSEALLRAVHTLNGAIAMVELPFVSNVLSPLEGYLKRVKNTNGLVDDRGIDALSNTADLVERMIKGIELGDVSNIDSSELEHSVVGLRDHLPEPETQFFYSMLGEDFDANALDLELDEVDLEPELVTELELPVSELKLPVTELELPVTELELSVTELELPVTELELPVTELELPVTELELPVTELELPVAELELPVTELELPVTELELPVTELELPVTELELPVTELELPVAELELPVTELELPVAELELSVTQDVMQDLDIAAIDLNSLNESLEPLSDPDDFELYAVSDLSEYDFPEVALSTSNPELSVRNDQLIADIARLEEQAFAPITADEGTTSSEGALDSGDKLLEVELLDLTFFDDAVEPTPVTAVMPEQTYSVDSSDLMDTSDQSADVFADLSFLEGDSNIELTDSLEVAALAAPDNASIATAENHEQEMIGLDVFSENSADAILELEATNLDTQDAFADLGLFDDLEISDFAASDAAFTDLATPAFTANAESTDAVLLDIAEADIAEADIAEEGNAAFDAETFTVVTEPTLSDSNDTSFVDLEALFSEDMVEFSPDQTEVSTAQSDVIAVNPVDAFENPAIAQSDLESLGLAFSETELLETVPETHLQVAESLQLPANLNLQEEGAVSSSLMAQRVLPVLADFDPPGPLVLADPDEELLEIFVQEGADILDTSDNMMARLREAPNDYEIVVGLQRELHTLKGGARMAGVNPIGDLSHSMESLFEAIVDKRANNSIVTMEALERSFDRLHQMVTRVGKRQAIGQPVNIIARLDALLDGDDEQFILTPEVPVVADLLPLEADQNAPDVPAVLAAKASTSPNAATPPVPQAVKAAPEAPARVERKTALDEDDGGQRQQQESIRVRADLIDNLVNYAGEVSIYRSRLEAQIGGFRFNLQEFDQTVLRLRDQLRKLEMETEAQILSRYQREETKKDMGFDPLELDRFSTLQQLSRALAESVSDLVSLQNLMDDIARQSETLLLQQSRVSTELQEGLMRTRMVPFDSLVPRLRRIIRQTGGELGKRAALKLEGAQGEMDRTVLDRMTAPLEHMLRNALAHGLELPQVRRAAGKPEEGTITVSVSREATEVVIKVSDDGRGMDRDAIRSKAIERGLLRADAQLSDRDLFQFVLEAGFSTAETVSKISGRGVGMDVVNSEIKQLGGSLLIDSVKGAGSVFSVRLPFTLSVTQAILIKLADTSYAVPLSSVQGVMRMPRKELERRIASSDMDVTYAGETFQIYDLGELIRQPIAYAKDEAQVPFVMTKSGDQRAAVRVSQVVGSKEVVVKSVGVQLSSVPGFFGATIMGDGSVIVILDLAPLVRHGAALRQAPELASELDLDVVVTAPVEVRRQKLVMVVDDSITMRKVTTRVLERNDMEVITAKDGLDAVEQLQDRVPDLMLLDIEMPRMDGYELATYVKNDSRLKHIPIIMITSRTGEKHRQRAMEIGVERYLGKPYQEVDLLKNVMEMLNGVNAK